MDFTKYIEKVDKEVALAKLRSQIPQHGHNVPSIRRNLGHEADSGRRGSAVLDGTPGDNVLISQRHLRFDGSERIEALVVCRTVDIHPERLSVE